MDVPQAAYLTHRHAPGTLEIFPIMLTSFRVMSLIEGLSLLVLLFIAMPARYQFGHDFVWPVGMTHGLLWMAFFCMALIVSHRQNWSVLAWLGALLCSVIPFGFVVLDRRLKQEQAAQAA